MAESNDGSNQTSSNADEIKDINGVKIYLNKLMKNVNEAMLDDMKNRFQLYKKSRVNKKELLDILESYKIILSDEDMNPMFAKIDINKKGWVDFLDFTTYLAYEFETVRIDQQLIAKGKPQIMPRFLMNGAIVYNSGVPNKITGIEFIPFTNQPSSQTQNDNGMYVLNNETGGIQFYTPDMKWISTHQICKEKNIITWMAVLPNYDVICVSTGSQLQFYGADAIHFQLRMAVAGVRNVTCMAYTYDEHGNSRLAAGTSSGDVLVLDLSQSSSERSPFYQDPQDVDLSSPVYDVIKLTNGRAAPKGRLPFRAVWFAELHPTLVSAVAFCDEAGQWMVSVSQTRTRSVAYCHPDRRGLRGDKRDVVRYGATAFGARCACAAGAGRVATGDQLGSVTVWDVHKARMPAVAELRGHSAPVYHVFYDQAAERLFSVSTDLTVVSWDVATSDKLLTLHVSAALPDGPRLRPPVPHLAAHFDRATLVLAVAVGDQLVAYKCNEYYGRLVSERPRAGCSHDAPVVKTMYNPLLNVLVSASAADSTIIVWNPSTGRLIVRRGMAHRQVADGKTIRVEITAAAFDPSLGLLVTGAADGTVNMWNPNDLTLLCGCRAPSGDRILGMVWTSDGISTTGPDRRLTTFCESFDSVSQHIRYAHQNEVFSQDKNQRSRLAVATISAGVIGFCRSSKHTVYVRGVAESPDEHGTAVTTHFLHSRPEAVGVGNLLVAMRDGAVHLWRAQNDSARVAQFAAAHAHGDHVTCMSSDARDQFLFTGFGHGHVKTWYVAAFGCPRPAAAASQQSLRLRFPFLLHSLFVGPARRAAAENTAGPLLVNSYRAHTQAVTHVEYVNGPELLVTSSVDKSIRVWTLDGHFVGILGTPWPSLPTTGPVDLTYYDKPSDIIRVASYTTMKVLENTVNSELRSTAFWESIQVLREQRQLEGRTIKSQLQGDDYSFIQLPSDVSDEHSETDIQDQGPLKLINYNAQSSRLQVFKYLPISDPVEIPDAPIFFKSKNVARNKKINFG